MTRSSSTTVFDRNVAEIIRNVVERKDDCNTHSLFEGNIRHGLFLFHGFDTRGIVTRIVKLESLTLCNHSDFLFT